MTQRHSEYKRIPGDTYVTPQWVWEALYDVEPWASSAWDCCPQWADFDYLESCGALNIATNPPFKISEGIIRKAIGEAEKVAMLLPVTWDCAKGRKDLFNKRPFKCKYILTTRIHWENIAHKRDKNGRLIQPASNHAWYIWDRSYVGPPMMRVL